MNPTQPNPIQIRLGEQYEACEKLAVAVPTSASMALFLCFGVEGVILILHPMWTLIIHPALRTRRVVADSSLTPRVAEVPRPL
jgi:hypothetical protein